MIPPAVEQSSPSQRLAVLRRVGFVVSRREGSRVISTLADERVGELLALAREMLLGFHSGATARRLPPRDVRVRRAGRAR
ncbi:MAG TPA: hypothetical protein VNT03_20575 [Baekduia sp.]|nr:hypothetical protein [Baekduia sp.]